MSEWVSEWGRESERGNQYASEWMSEWIRVREWVNEWGRDRLSVIWMEGMNEYSELVSERVSKWG